MQRRSWSDPSRNSSFGKVRECRSKGRPRYVVNTALATRESVITKNNVGSEGYCDSDVMMIFIAIS